MKRLLCKAAGSKEGNTDAEADKVCMIRILVIAIPLIITLICEIHIMAGIWRHWDKEEPQYVYVDSTQCKPIENNPLWLPK